MPLVELLTEASKAEVKDERSVQLMLDYME